MVSANKARIMIIQKNRWEEMCFISVYPNLIDPICIFTSGETNFFHRINSFTTSIHLFKDTSRTEMIWRVWVYRIDEVYFNLFHISLSINCGTTRRTKANAAITNCEYNQLTKSFID